MDEAPLVLETAVDAASVRRIVRRLAGEVARAYAPGDEALAIVVLEGARTFAGDLLGETALEVETATISAESYGGGTASSGEVRIGNYAGPPVKDRHCLLIDDIYDTGLTLASLVDRLKRLGAASVRTCVLLAKHKVHRREVPLDFVGTQIDDRFVVGYGLDHRGRYRDLAYVAYALPAE